LCFLIVKTNLPSIFSLINCKKLGYEEAIPFSNSMSVSDYHRIDSIKSGQNTKYSNFAFKHGNSNNVFKFVSFFTAVPMEYMLSIKKGSHFLY
jgi:hypothetical protein